MKKNIVIFFALSIVYWMLSEVCQGLTANTSTKILAFRLSGFVPMTAGLLFGPIGALGCALGNFFVDLRGTFDLSDVFGTAGVFLMGWLPYKLWHTLFFAKKKQIALLHSAKSVMKFTAIAFISAVCASSMGAFGGYVTGNYKYIGFAQQVVLQYFNLSIIIGMPIILLISRSAKIEPYVPLRAYSREHNFARYLVDLVLALLICIMMFVIFYLDYNEILRSLALALSCVQFVLIIILSILPMTRGEKKCLPLPRRRMGGLQGQILMGVLILLGIMLMVYALFMEFLLYRDLQVISAVNHFSVLVSWLRVLSSIEVLTIIFVLAIAVLLHWMDTHVIRPLEEVSDYVRCFVSGEELTQGSLQLPYVNNEMDTLADSVNKMAENIRDYTEQLEKKVAAEQRLAMEMSAARDIQMTMLPKKWVGAGFDIAAQIKPAREVGGDFYDFRLLAENRAFVAVADVTGKGVSAALFMARAKTLMDARLELPLCEMMTQVNQILNEENDKMMFVTMFAAVVDRQAGILRYVNAGHNPPVVYTDGQILLLNDEPDFVLGPMLGAQYTEKSLPLSPDFALFLYTDGVTEAENTEQVFFGEERLVADVEKLFQTNRSEHIVHEIMDQVNHFAAGAEQSDDITVLCLKVMD